jgi:N-acetylglucosaminyldiphosphoundecaprenol N-acetyl-beta-D-mannosaminyltransferase
MNRMARSLADGSYPDEAPLAESPGALSLDGAPVALGPADADAAGLSAAGVPAVGEYVPRVRIWGLPLARLAAAQTVDLVERLIRRGRPSFFITANLHYAMLSDRDPQLARVNRQAAFLLADGMPMVWYSRLIGNALPERVAGADLIYALCQRAAERGQRLFLLGGAPGVAQEAAANLCRRYPGLQIVGAEAPPFRPLSAQEQADLVRRIRRRHPDLLLVAFGQPKGELWLAENYRALGVPVSVQVGATLDFVAGRIRRAPRWLQGLGLEWMFRAMQEPRRLGPRYFADLLFLGKAMLRDVWRWRRRPGNAVLVP